MDRIWKDWPQAARISGSESTSARVAICLTFGGGERTSTRRDFVSAALPLAMSSSDAPLFKPEHSPTPDHEDEPPAKKARFFEDSDDDVVVMGEEESKPAAGTSKERAPEIGRAHV